MTREHMRTERDTGVREVLLKRPLKDWLKMTQGQPAKSNHNDV